MPDENSYNSELLGTLLLIDAQAFAYGDELETLDSIIDAHVANLSPEDQKYVSTLRSFGPELTDKTVDDKYNQLNAECAAIGFPGAQYQTGCRLREQGKSELALELFKSAANQGHAASQYCFGLQTFYGDGTAKDEAAGLIYIEMAAGRLYEYALDFLIGLYGPEGARPNPEREALYSKMLAWAKNPLVHS